MFVILIAGSLHLFERGIQIQLHFIEQSGTKGIAKVGVIEMFYLAPMAIITETAFGDQTVDMRIPFQIPPKCVEDHDETGSEVFGFVHFMEHA